MFRTTAARAVPKSLVSLRAPAARIPVSKFVQQAAFRTSTRSVKTSPVLALERHQPIQKSLVRYASTGKVVYTQDAEAEKASGSKSISPHPEYVSTQSSVHNAFTETATQEQEQDVDMMAGVRSDFVWRT